MEIVYPNSEPGCAIVTMPFSEWLAVQEPEFFDVEGEHRGFAQHIPSLYGYSTTVVLLKVGDVLFKLNGHSRKQAWLNGTLAEPSELTCLVYDVSEADFLTLSAEVRMRRLEALPVHEVVKHAYQQLGLVFESDRLRNGFITEAIHIALRGRQRHLQNKRSNKEREDIDMRKAIDLFKRDLLLIDSLSPKGEIFTTGVLAGSLIMLGLNKPITEFLRLLNNKQGQVKDDSYDPVASLLKQINRHNKSQRTTQPRMAIDLAKKTVQAISYWLEGERSGKYWRARDLTGHELMPLIMEMKRLKMINAERDL